MSLTGSGLGIAPSHPPMPQDASLTGFGLVWSPHTPQLLMPRSMLGSRGILRELDCCSNCPILDGCVVRGGGSPVGPVARRGVRSAARRARGTAERRRTAGVRHGWRGGQLELRERDIRRTHARDRRSSSLRGSTRHRSAQRPHSPATNAIVMQ